MSQQTIELSPTDEVIRATRVPTVGPLMLVVLCGTVLASGLPMFTQGIVRDLAAVFGVSAILCLAQRFIYDIYGRPTIILTKQGMLFDIPQRRRFVFWCDIYGLQHVPWDTAPKAGELYGWTVYVTQCYRVEKVGSCLATVALVKNEEFINIACERDGFECDELRRIICALEIFHPDAGKTASKDNPKG